MAHSNTLEISYASQIDGSNLSVSMAFIACLEAQTSLLIALASALAVLAILLFCFSYILQK